MHTAHSTQHTTHNTAHSTQHTAHTQHKDTDTDTDMDTLHTHMHTAHSTQHTHSTHNNKITREQGGDHVGWRMSCSTKRAGDTLGAGTHWPNRPPGVAAQPPPPPPPQQQRERDGGCVCVGGGGGGGLRTKVEDAQLEQLVLLTEGQLVDVTGRRHARDYKEALWVPRSTLGGSNIGLFV